MADSDDRPKGGFKRLIKLAMVALILLGVLGGGGWFGWKAFKSWKAKKAARAQAQAANPAQAKDEDEDEASAEGGHGAAAPAILVYKQIVNLEGGARRNAYLKCELHILIRDQELGKQVTSEKATPQNSEMRALLLEHLSGRTVEEVTDMESRERLREELRDKLNEKFAPKPLKPGEDEPKQKRPRKPVKEVLVVDWAIQQ